MRSIKKPKILSSEVLINCIDNMQDKALKQELVDSIGIFDNAEKDLNDKLLITESYKISQNQTISDTINASILKDIYTERMVNKTNKGRKYYDAIMLSSPNGICPLCSQRIARTLDHYLPKSQYPLFSITPINLIPACTDCNKDKFTRTPKTSEEETLHPYYDNIENQRWLKTRIVHLKPIIFEYYIECPEHFTELLKKRIQNHFDVYLLNRLYSTHASEEFENIKLQLTKLFNVGGAITLKEHLMDCFISRVSINKNSWQTSFYDCLVQKGDFLKGLFI